MRDVTANGKIFRFVLLVVCTGFLASCGENQFFRGGDSGFFGAFAGSREETVPVYRKAQVGSSVRPGSAKDFLVNVGDGIFFTVNSSDLTYESKVTLDRQAKWLQKYPEYHAVIEGHADERGTRQYNLALSARRAEVTRSYLIRKGIQSSRLEVRAYGKERPVATCDDISCWSQNRRVVTVVGRVHSF